MYSCGPGAHVAMLPGIAGFDIDEEGIQTGVSNMSLLAINFLSETYKQF